MAQHPHKCVHCRQLFQCAAPQQANYDGWPDVVCESYHIEGNDWCENCLGQMLYDQAHDGWWEAIGGPELDAQLEAGDAS